MPLPQVENALTQAELRLDAVSNALLASDLTELDLVSDQLRQTAMEISRLLQGVEPAILRQPALRLRIKRIAGGVQHQREALIRRAVTVERGLHVLVEGTQPAATYANASGPYASSGKSSGAFKLLVA
jgi:hypothetical protein